MSPQVARLLGLLASGHKLEHYRATRWTHAGWLINNEAFHAGTVNAACNAPDSPYFKRYVGNGLVDYEVVRS